MMFMENFPIFEHLKVPNFYAMSNFYVPYVTTAIGYVESSNGMQLTPNEARLHTRIFRIKM
jgi:hypothetical protein